MTIEEDLAKMKVAVASLKAGCEQLVELDYPIQLAVPLVLKLMGEVYGTRVSIKGFGNDNIKPESKDLN